MFVTPQEVRDFDLGQYTPAKNKQICHSFVTDAKILFLAQLVCMNRVLRLTFRLLKRS